MKVMAGRVKEWRTRPTEIEESPEYEPPSNALAGQCVQTVKDMFKTPRRALQHRLGGQVPDDHPTLAWLLRHAACLRNSYHVGQDGRMPWYRVAGKRSAAAVAEFNESVRLLTNGPNKEIQWSVSIWLGLVVRTRETYIGTPDGVVRALTIKSVIERDRWNVDEVLAARGATQ